MHSLVKSPRNSQSQTCDRTKRTHTVPPSQLTVFGAKPTERPRSKGNESQGRLLALYATSSVCKQPDGRRWWNIRCSYNRKMFGGLYSAAERDRILEIFNGTASQVTPQKFELVAERVIAETTQRQGVAA